MRRLTPTPASLAVLVLASACTHTSTPTPAPAPLTPTSASPTPGTATGPMRLGRTAANQVPLGKPGTPRGGVQRPDVHDAAQVARAVAITSATWDTRLDYSAQDAARRAARWMSPELATRTRTARTGGSGAGWNALAAGQGWTTATASAWVPSSTTDHGRAVVVPLMVVSTPHVTHGTAPASWNDLQVITLRHATPTKVAAKTSTPAPSPTASAQPTAAPVWQVVRIEHRPNS